MLVRNTVEYDARVRKSARSLTKAGYEVIVLGGAPAGSSATRSWEGFELRLVPRRNSVLERDARARRLVAKLAARVDETGERTTARPDRPTSTRPASLLDRGRTTFSRRRRWRAKQSHDRAKGALVEARGAKRQRDAEDPLRFGVYEETWWPVVRQLRPDVVHTHDAHGVLVARRAKARGARWIYDAHEDPLKKGDKHPDREEPIRRSFAEHVQHADAVITVSDGLAERLRRTFALRRTPVVVHNTPPLDGEDASPRPGLREQAGVGPDTPLVVYVGSMTRWHKQSVILEALTSLPGVHLALVVSPSNRFVQETVELANRLGISDRVNVVPKVPPESLVAFIREADVGVCPLVRYPNAEIALPNKLFEYLHAGLPLVVSDCATMGEFVRSHGLGAVASLDDPQAWAAGIEHALRAHPYRDRPDAWEALKREWSWERQEKRLLGLYRPWRGDPTTSSEPS